MMYPTDEEIEACLDDVDDEELVALLDKSEELSYLSRAIVRGAVYSTARGDMESFIEECSQLVLKHLWELANKIAREKKERTAFSCEMKDEFN